MEENKAVIKCINKWEKRLRKNEDQMKRWGHIYWTSNRFEIPIIQEILKDLKRLYKIKT